MPDITLEEMRAVYVKSAGNLHDEMMAHRGDPEDFDERINALLEQNLAILERELEYRRERRHLTWFGVKI